MITALVEGAGLTCHCSLLRQKEFSRNRAPLTLQEVWKTLEKYRSLGGGSKHQCIPGMHEELVVFIDAEFLH